MQAAHPAFKLKRDTPIRSLKLHLYEYEHLATGAQHIHLAADNPENVFLVALRTVPEDSTGVAHILEHTALCGSRKYPVRDPFFMMTRRSLNTFMNAFTSSDWTAYPFASTNRKDFNNLLDVYLDAVFFARLDPLDFAQEGHRLEFAEPNNPSSPLEYKGVVYNEMKGAMSSVSSMLWHTLQKYLHPATTYHYNSGGEPESIPDLTYQDLKHFYETHYHPSNAVFMTYGDLPAAELQAKFESGALAQFERLASQISVPDEKRYFAPVRVQEHYPLAAGDNDGRKHHVIVGWLLGQSRDLHSSLTTQLVSSVLLDNSASPLLHALETTELGNAPSPLCGLDDSHKEMAFVCGVEGAAADGADAVEALIMATLERVAAEGVPQADLEAALHQLELHQREIGGDSYPYGLQLIMNGLTAATHRGDVIAMLDLDGALADLRERAQAPDFLQRAVRELFLDNPHRVRLVLSPDSELAERRERAVRTELDRRAGSLTAAQQQALVDQAAALAARQVREDDESILPKVTLADVPAAEAEPEYRRRTAAAVPLTEYPVGTNGLVYQQLVVELPELPRELANLLPLYSSCVTELGVGNRDYLAVQKWQAGVAGGFSAYTAIKNLVDDVANVSGHLVFSGKALNHNYEKLCELAQATLAEARFDELPRLAELVAQMRAQREKSVTGSGHSLAMGAAQAGLSSAAQYGYEVGGLKGIRALKALDNGLSDAAALEALASALSDIHARVRAAPLQCLLIAEPERLAELSAKGDAYLASNAQDAGFQPFSLPFSASRTAVGWLADSAVNYCARAYATVPMTHPDAAPLTVLGHVLRNNFLHRTIREQGGAYGGGASQDCGSAAFKFYSYRDPRLADTLKDFDAAVDWVQSTPLKWQFVEEAILGVVAGIDKPDSPAGRAKRHFHAELSGRTHALRQAYRAQILSVQADDLKRVAATYLDPRRAHTAVVTDHSRADKLRELDLSVEVL